MKVTTEEVEYIAELARLAFSSEEKSILASEMSRILDYVEKLNELDITDVEPMTHVMDLYNVERDDVVMERITREQSLSAAPDADSEYFRVPKVIDA
jgi:aspartyl-tRNA(Asn)/glutamyl-tRNA(Gln) amidotransferase subunit C